MKNPNGTGGIIKLSGKRRRPYAVRITLGIVQDDKSALKQIQRYIGYYATKQEAQAALVDYNKGFYNIDLSNITFAEMFERFTKIKFQSISPSQQEAYTSANFRSKPLHGMRFADIKASHMQNVINEYGKSYSSRVKMKTLYNQMYIAAIQDDIVQKNYATHLSVGADDTREIHGVISDKDIKKLWKSLHVPYVDYLLILLFTGMRRGELIRVKTEDVNLGERYLIGGSKTEAGRNRIIPIHESLMPFFQERMSGEYLFEEDGKPLADHQIRNRIEKAQKELNLSFLAHDTRVTFISNMRRAEADLLITRRIVGHSDKTITEKVYTKVGIQSLVEEVDKLSKLPIFLSTEAIAI